MGGRWIFAGMAILIALASPGLPGRRDGLLAGSGTVLHRNGQDLEIDFDPLTGTPRTIRAIGSSLLEVGNGSALSREEAAGLGTRLVQEYGDLLKIRPDQIRLLEADKVSGSWYLSYQQVADGVGVYGASLGFSVDPGGRIESLGARLYPDARAPGAAKIRRDEALKIAQGHIRDYREMEYTLRSESVLIYPDRGTRSIDYYRAYVFNFFPGKATHPASVAEGRAVFVDARSGDIVNTRTLFKPLGCCLPAEGVPGGKSR